MSRYPDGMPSSSSYVAEVRCENCGHTYESRIDEDMGAGEIMEDCPTCEGRDWCKDCDMPKLYCECEE